MYEKRDSDFKDWWAEKFDWEHCGLGILEKHVQEAFNAGWHARKVTDYTPQPYDLVCGNCHSGMQTGIPCKNCGWPKHPWDEDYDAPITKTSENVEFVRADKQSSTEQLLEAYELLVTKTAMMLIKHGDPCLLVDWDQIRQPVHASKK